MNRLRADDFCRVGLFLVSNGAQPIGRHIVLCIVIEAFITAG